eukprot:Seg2294.3 transcript_id=Seg2294.3/GoldUCD/mRNA.D3Y31 product="putative prolyl 4-hydroxylase 10" protein_id=Seg2294.3/GoldUCD/D3Y31
MAGRSAKNGVRKRENKPTTRHPGKRSGRENKSINIKYVVMLIAAMLALALVALLGLFLARGWAQNDNLSAAQADTKSRNTKENRPSKSNAPKENKLQKESRKTNVADQSMMIPKEALNFQSSIRKTLSPVSMNFNGRNIEWKEIPHKHKESNVHVYIADNFLSNYECDGLTGAHFKHVEQTSKQSPIVCFAGIETMNKHLKEIGYHKIASIADFTGGTLCVNETFSKEIAPKFSYSYSTAFYKGDSKFSETFEEQVEKATSLARSHGGKFQITSYQTGVGYKNHTDCTEDEETRDRFATILVYLQDVKSGGETKFPKLGISVKPKKGRALVWNNMKPDGSCDPMSVHNAAKVVNGRKVIIQRW